MKRPTAAAKSKNRKAEPLAGKTESLRRAETAEILGLDLAVYLRLILMGTPVILYEVLKYTTRISKLNGRCDVDFLEFFCGVGSLVRPCQDLGMTAIGYDLLCDRDYMDINSAKALSWQSLSVAD